jgi:hypothetical protein
LVPRVLIRQTHISPLQSRQLLEHAGIVHPDLLVKSGYII